MSYIRLLCELFSIVKLELSDIYETPREIPDLLECIEALPALFDKYIDTHQQHGRTEPLIRIHNILEVILNELKVLKYNVQVGIDRSRELVTDDELVSHFIKTYKAWLRFKKASGENIDISNRDLCASCVFKEREPNPMLEEAGPEIIAAIEKLTQTLQDCYDKLQVLGEVVLTDRGAIFEKRLP
jgi:lipopolysaccharide biosynthesis glycosyltransferase